VEAAANLAGPCQKEGVRPLTPALASTLQVRLKEIFFCNLNHKYVTWASAGERMAKVPPPPGSLVGQKLRAL